MVMDIRKTLFWGGLAPALIIATACTVPEPELRPESVFLGPDFSVADMKSVALYVDMTDLPAAGRDPLIVSTAEAELKKRGFDVIGHNAVVSFLKARGITPSEADKPRLLTKLREELGRAAIVRLRVEAFVILGKTADPLRTVTPGTPGTRALPGQTTTDAAIRDRWEWVIDVALRFDLTETATGGTVWSSSLKHLHLKYDGKIEDFVRKAIDACLDTLPAR